MQSFSFDKCRWLIICLALTVVWSGLAAPATAGPYRDSAHGSANFGVNRSTIDGKYIDYATGGCAHCHEMHASMDGTEPAPSGGAAAHILFADSFNETRTRNLYLESDNFCFFCHNDETGPQVTNQDYSEAFGGATGGGPQSIMDAFNQASYHNLYDIWSLLRTDPAYGWFGNAGNPCSACHNPHLAKRNWDSAQPGFPLASAISSADNHNALWGEAELMSSYFSYEAPYAFAPSREPAGAGQADGSKTPDYVTFCTHCHTPDKVIWSTTLNRELKRINWGPSGLSQDKHGVLARDGASAFREPYAGAAASKGNFVLSCLDCHEAHGSENIMLLRRRVNGEDLEGGVVSTDVMSYVCKRCHQDDLAASAGTGQADRWEYIHHDVAGAPYGQQSCGTCHAGDEQNPQPIACGNCHGHGMTDSILPAGVRSNRTTF